MTSAENVFERFASDEAFRNVALDGLEAKRDAGESDPAKAFVEVAAELGYEVSAEQANAFFSRPDKRGGLNKLSDDSLDEVAAGYTFMKEKSGLNRDQLIDDKTGEVLWEGTWPDAGYAIQTAREFGVSAKSITWEELSNLRKYGSINP